MTVPARVVALRGGRGRQSALVEDIRDRRDDLTAHNAEALELVEAAWPHVSALQRMAIELGPIALQHTLALTRLLHRYEARHTPDDDPGAAVAA